MLVAQKVRERISVSAWASAGRLALIYAIVGVLWITLSDWAVEALVTGRTVTVVQTYKGWAFVGATAVFILVMVNRALAKHAEAARALSESDRRFRMYLRHAPTAVFVLDHTGRCLEANERGAELIGCSPADLLSLSVADVTPPGADEPIARAAMARLTTEGWADGEYRLLRRDGRPIWISVRAVALENGRLLAFAYDITERRRSEDRLRQAAAVFASTHEGVVITDAQGRIQRVNPAFTAITGYEEAEAIGRDPRILQSGVQNRDWYRNMWRDLLEAGYWQGEIWNRRKSGEIYPEWLTISAVLDEDRSVVNYVGVFTDISRAKSSEAAIDHLAHTDALTGLPNRLLLTSRLAHAVQRARQADTKLAVMCIDIDRFKQVNDSLGFDAGDEVLQAVATRLQTVLREADTLARLGADEFVVVIEEVSDADGAAAIARELVAAFAQPFEISTNDALRVGASIGISMFPDDGRSAEQLLQRAGAAVNYVKDAGGRGLSFHARAMVEASQARFALEAALHRALERDEFVLHYQPRVVLTTGAIEGVEALVRWRRPDGVLVSPLDFVPVAEATGLIEPLGDWVLREACVQMRRWLDEGCALKTTAVNVSARQFHDPAFVERVRTVLSEVGLPGKYLELEVTESGIMDTGDEANARLAELRRLGVRLAIDDFGTGYSSLANVRRLPVDTLKIDRSFLTEVPQDRVSSGVVLMITALAAHLGLQTVAEGVENAKQRDLLVRAGCQLAQGFLFSRPVPSEEISRQIRGHRRNGERRPAPPPSAHPGTGR